ncbi:aminoglycoside 6-adenylyltransferase [Metaclostridioides mangenotii]|uniref:aminoglycoside 6-adenylyltransferase n=1 Tax=Metaclostridioides mangenotii TaxID=1540 RepID=UPI0004854827|nr:aminoglycoside 6-adenylyltransferase [Clostridioides mangenotii]
MRTEDEMYKIILDFANQDKRVRAVALNGSRANDEIKKDKFQDYDIVYIVDDEDYFIKNDSWLDVFGDRIFMQKPNTMKLFESDYSEWFSYLMLFKDGNRIDLRIVPIEKLEIYLKEDKFTKILLDKNGYVKDIPRLVNDHYRIKKPSVDFYLDCCNEFWWVSTYVAKGLCRDELLYACEHLNSCVRPELFRMISWNIGVDTDFNVNLGKSYKYLNKYIEDEIFNEIMKTYRTDTVEDIWDALFITHNLFRKYSFKLANSLNYIYPDYDKNICNYIKSIKEI